MILTSTSSPNYYTVTTDASEWTYWTDGSRIYNYPQSNANISITPVVLMDYSFIFKLLREMLTHNPNRGSVYDLELLLEKMEKIVKMENDPDGISTQLMEKIARCMSFEEIDRYKYTPEEEDFEDEFGPFRLEEE